MDFWIAVLGAVLVLAAQWAVISLVALGSLRRSVQGAFRELAGPMGRYLKEGAEAAEKARGFGVEAQILRRQREAGEKLGVFLEALAQEPMEKIDLAEFRNAWASCIRGNQAVNHTVLALPCVVEGWAGVQSELGERCQRVQQALSEYNTAVQAYRYRWKSGATSLAGRWFGYGPLEEWPTEEVSTLQGW